MDAYLFPDLRRDLLSLSSLRNDYKILFNRGVDQRTAYKGRCVAIAAYHDSLYYITQPFDGVAS